MSSTQIRRGENPSDWLEYNETNRRDRKMAQLWVKPLVRWILDAPPLGMGLKADAKVLDFGCGYLDAGIALRQRAGVIDGFDIDPYACNMAESALREHGQEGQIYRKLEEIPRLTYDVVILNSVMQYFGTVDRAQETLNQLSQTLKHGGKIVVADLIPTDYVSFLDGLNSLWVGAQNRCLRAMVRHLWHALTKKSELSLLQIDHQTMASIVKDLGMKMELLAKNLTPSPFRYTVVLSQSSSRD